MDQKTYEHISLLLELTQEEGRDGRLLVQDYLDIAQCSLRSLIELGLSSEQNKLKQIVKELSETDNHYFWCDNCGVELVDERDTTEFEGKDTRLCIKCRGTHDV